jgi:hypothetical protein
MQLPTKFVFIRTRAGVRQPGEPLGILGKTVARAPSNRFIKGKRLRAPNQDFDP